MFINILFIFNIYSNVRSRNVSLVSIENGNINILHVKVTTSLVNEEDDL